jgi:hypothetical protein
MTACLRILDTLKDHDHDLFMREFENFHQILMTALPSVLNSHVSSDRNMFNPLYYSVANYYNEARQKEQAGEREQAE